MVAQLAAKVHISTRGSRRDQEKASVVGEGGGGGMQCGQALFSAHAQEDTHSSHGPSQV